MFLSQKIIGRIVLLAGSASVSIVGGFVHLNGGLKVTPPIDDMGLSLQLLIGYFIVAILFQYGIPLLSTATLCLGFSVKNLLTAKIGIAFALLSMFCYILFIRGCVQMIW